MAGKKRTSLDCILPVPASQSSLPSRTPVDAATAIPATLTRGASQRKQLAVHLDHPVYQQLRTLAFEEETKMHPLLLEGLDRVFADRGLPSIAELLERHSE
jgi:hypothetical protein